MTSGLETVSAFYAMDVKVNIQENNSAYLLLKQTLCYQSVGCTSGKF